MRQKALGLFNTYILYSKKLNKYYIGSTKDVSKRLKLHNKGRVIFTSRGIPWTLIHKESFGSRSEVYKREKEIKSYKGGFKFKALINEKVGEPLKQN